MSGTTKAINYHHYYHRSGSTAIDFRGTELMPQACDWANAESQRSRPRSARMWKNYSRRANFAQNPCAVSHHAGWAAAAESTNSDFLNLGSLM